MPTKEQRHVWMGMARLVSHLSHVANDAIEAAAGISLSEMTLMGQVRALDGSARMVDLASRLGVSKAAITKLVDSLERSGYLKRGTDPNDRRVSRIALTITGAKIASRAGASFEASMQDGLWDHMTKKETAEMLQTLEKIQAKIGLRRGGVLPPQ